MVIGYVQNGHVNEALYLFKIMPKQNVGSWNALIIGYSYSEDHDEAPKFFLQMKLTDTKPNLTTFSSILSSCTNL